MTTVEEANSRSDLSRLLDDSGETLRLAGGRCRGCGTWYFPISPSCRNPACEAKGIVAAGMGGVGELYSWTRVAYQPPPPFRMDDWKPHLLGLVEIPERLHVMAMIVDADTEQLRVGLPLQLTTVKLYQEAGRDVITYAYRPVEGLEAG